MLRSTNAFFEGGLNTIMRVFDVGTTTGGRIIGIVPKNGKIVRVRFHGSAVETDLSAQVFVRALAGSPVTTITADTDLDAVFTSVSAAHAGVEAVFNANQAARFVKDTQVVTVLITSTGGSVGELAVVVNYEPSP